MQEKNFKFKEKGFQNINFYKEVFTTYTTERNYYRIRIPMNLIKEMKTTDYTGYEEILPGKIICFIDRKDNTQYSKEHIFTVQNIENCFINTRNIDIDYYIGNNFISENGELTPNDFVEVNFFRIHWEENIVDDKIVIIPC